MPIDQFPSRWRLTGKYLPGLACFLALGILPVHAGEPVIGAWRAVQDRQASRQYWFAMLPQTVPDGSSFVAVDWKARKLVCCLAVRGREVLEDSLRNKFRIPGVWVTDLVNGWNLDHPPYRPRVFELIPSAVFQAHRFAGDAPSTYGGLLLPEDSHLDERAHLIIGNERYRAKYIEKPLAAGDGAVDSYTLIPASGDRQIVVEVPFGNN